MVKKRRFLNRGNLIIIGLIFLVVLAVLLFNSGITGNVVKKLTLVFKTANQQVAAEVLGCCDLTCVSSDNPPRKQDACRMTTQAQCTTEGVKSIAVGVCRVPENTIKNGWSASATCEQYTTTTGTLTRCKLKGDSPATGTSSPSTPSSPSKPSSPSSPVPAKTPEKMCCEVTCKSVGGEKKTCYPATESECTMSNSAGQAACMVLGDEYYLISIMYKNNAKCDTSVNPPTCTNCYYDSTTKSCTAATCNTDGQCCDRTRESCQLQESCKCQDPCSDDKNCLKCLLMSEAQSLSDKPACLNAIAWSVVNRMEFGSSHYGGSTMCDVIKSPMQYSELNPGAGSPEAECDDCDNPPNTRWCKCCRNKPLGAAEEAAYQLICAFVDGWWNNRGERVRANHYRSDNKLWGGDCGADKEVEVADCPLPHQMTNKDGTPKVDADGNPIYGGGFRFYNCNPAPVPAAD